MDGIRLHESGLRTETLDRPRLGPGDALVEVHAAAITRDELTWPMDRLPAIPSYEVSGVVVAVADEVADVAPGDEVYGLTPFDRDGVAAAYAAVPAAVLAPKPRSLNPVESAAIPMGALTAWQGLFDNGRLAPGERLMITGSAGGVGHLAAQLARWRGAEVSGSGAAADLVFDTAGDFDARGGRLVSIADEPPPGAGIYFVVEPSGDQLRQITPLVEDGTLVPAIDSVYELADAAAAFARVQERGKRGKVVIRVRR